MGEPTYAELLQDERWKVFSQAVMMRALRRCESCGDTDVRLNAHHTYYKRGLLPWEYPLDSLRCWCETCHARFHELKEQLQELTGEMSVRTFHYLVIAARRLAAADRHARREEHQPELASIVGDIVGRATV